MSAARSSQVLDVLVVGGGPAGLAAAIAARRAGLRRVRVIDHAPQGPIDKACGEGLMPDGLAALGRLGVDIAALPGRPFYGIRYVDAPEEAFTGLPRPAAAEGRFPGPPGRGVRRTDLHRALLARAEEVGVEVEWGARAGELLSTGDPADEARPARIEVGGREVAARRLVAADGLRSRLRRGAGLERPAKKGAALRFGVRRHFRTAPWTDLVEVHWAEGSEAYVTPVGPAEVGVALLWTGGPRPAEAESRGGFDALLPRFPLLARRLAGSSAASRDRGSGPLLQRARGVVQGRVALVGDASGYLDAITGEGLSLAFHQALALEEALRAGDLAAYAAAHRKIGRLPDAMTRLMLAVERRPWLRRRVIRALAAEPALFDRLLGVHARAVPLRRVGIRGAARLAWRLAEAR